MSPENRQRLSEWLTPGNIINLVGILVMVVSVWAVNNYRLGDVSKAIEEIRIDISAIRGEQKEVIRQQERLNAAIARIETLERFTETQTVYNQTMLRDIARLQKGRGDP